MSRQIQGWPPIGSVWKDMDPRTDRQVTIVAHDKASGVGIQSAGSMKMTWAKPERFNGKRGGYKRVA